jgi:hypothetical protein
MRAQDPIIRQAFSLNRAAGILVDEDCIGAAVQIYVVPGQSFGTKVAMAASRNNTILFHYPEAVRETNSCA